MDINSLLSPQESPARETPQPPPPSQQQQQHHSARASPAAQSPRAKRAIRQVPSRTPSGLSQEITSSPQTHRPYHHSQHQQQMPSPGLSGFTNGHVHGHRPIHSATSTPPLERVHSPRDARATPPHLAHRQASTPGMDALADLAAMQHQQQTARQNSVAQRPTFNLQNIPRTISAGSASEITMAEASPKPRTFASKALEQAHIDYLIQLDKSLTENPLDYYSHVSFVTILHQGFEYHVAHIDPANPRSYELLPIMRDAYQTMANKYPLGEVLWEYRLNDEKALAMNVEDRLSVLEYYKQATVDEPYSTKIWHSYGEYIAHLIACSWEQVPPEQWSHEDKEKGRQLFQPQLLMDIWQQGAAKVKYSLQDSSMVWDRYLQCLRDELLRTGPTHERVGKVMSAFHERLGQPHATWANTLSLYASFVSSVNGDPEAAMEQAVQQNSHIKQQYTNREEFEFKLLQAMQQGDRDAEYYAMTRYLKWEKKTLGIYSTHLVNALYERATLRFPVDSSLWQDHVEFLIWQNDRSIDLLDVVERATQHCPWSGSLWSHRILTLEAEQRSFQEIEGVKHTATNTGLLEHNDIEELIKVQIAWCGYLRRKAFDPQASEDDADIAEVGIRSALEHVREVGMKKYGRNWPGDPKYRLERIHIKFWLQRGNETEARTIWDTLVKSKQDSYEFWYRYYIWEMVLWANHATRTKENAGQVLLTPSGATTVLERGMQRLTTIDQPEPLIEMYVNHCEQHESVLKVRAAQIEQRRAERVVSIRKQKEAAAAAALQAEPQVNHAADVSGKRKREDGAAEDSPAKKSKQVEIVETPVASTSAPRAVSEAPSQTGSTTQKRDREHTSIIVQRLPQKTTQLHVRKFFTDAGTVRNVTLKQEKDSVTAFVEFETPEEAEYALAKEAKGFEGKDITIKRSESTTLYVANYPAHADEAYLRELFSPFGEILGIRFPSLKFDTHRRFCYIQFANADDAIGATQLDGLDVEGLKIIAKISNPNAKKKRDGATAEGREVYVWHLNFKAKKREIQDVFAPFGTIERINIPTMSNGNNKGFGYVVYTSKESAEKAVTEMNDKEFWGLALKVQIASDRTEAKPKVKSVIENTKAASPSDPEATPASDVGAPATASVPVADRSIAILNLPDTVNDTRVKSLMEPYGYKKITLMPQHGGAIIEFPTVDAAGKAEIALSGKDFDDRKLRIGTVKELKKQKGEYKAATNFIQPAHVRRPAPAGRGGARGGIGIRGRGGRPGLGARPAAPPKSSVTADNNVEAKSNQDFRTMLLGKKKEAEKEEPKAGEQATAARAPEDKMEP